MTDDNHLPSQGQKPRCTRRTFLKAGGTLGATLVYGGGADLLLRDDRWEPNESYWISTLVEPPRYPRLGENCKADVAVVGGGFTGLSSAYHIKTKFPDLKVILLEAHALGFGASGRNGGELVDYTASFERMPGTSDNVAFLSRLIRERGLECDLLGAQVNPYKLVSELGRLCAQSGVEIFEQSRVRNVNSGKTIFLTGDRFRIEAETVIVATNAYTSKLGLLRRELGAIHAACIVTESLGSRIETIPNSFVESIREGSDYYWGRTLPDGRVLFGGGVRYSYDNGLGFPGAKHLYPALGRAMRRIFPQTSNVNVEFKWNGPMGFFADSNPRLGRLGDHGNMYYGLGYAGMGVTMAVRFGHFIAEMLDGNQPPSWTMRTAPWMPGEPWRYMGINAGIHLTDFGWLKV